MRESTKMSLTASRLRVSSDLEILSQRLSTSFVECRISVGFSPLVTPSSMTSTLQDTSLLTRSCTRYSTRVKLFLTREQRVRKVLKVYLQRPQLCWPSKPLTQPKMETPKTDFTRALVLAQSEIQSQTKNWWCSKIQWTTDLVRTSKLQALLELEVSRLQRKETDLSNNSSVLYLSKIEIVRSKPQVSQVYIQKKHLGQLETRLMRARPSTTQGLKQLKPSHQSKTKPWPSLLKVHSLVKSRLKWWLQATIS